METKLAYESKRTGLNMNQKFGTYWATTWAMEVQRDVENENNALFKVPLTDARRSNLRAASRPAKGCKCCSLSHTYVNDSKCPLYRDVKQYCEANSINISDGRNKDSSKALSKKKNEAKSAIEKAYIDRFIKLRSEDAATREEAEFVLEMEKTQSSKMKKAVFAPPSLCTLVLSAVASVMDVVPEDGPAMDEKKSDVTSLRKKTVGRIPHQCRILRTLTPIQMIQTTAMMRMYPFIFFSKAVLNGQRQNETTRHHLNGPNNKLKINKL